METNQNQQVPETGQDQIAEYHDNIKHIELEGYQKRVKKARNALFLAAALILIAEVVVCIISAIEFDAFIITLITVIVGVFVALGLWTKKKPYTAIVLGIIWFVAYIIFVAVVNGYIGGAAGVFKAIFSGFIWKIIIFVALIRPLKDAKELQREKQEKTI